MAGDSVNEKTTPGLSSLVTDQADYLIATAARAPSVHNTQPWRFRVSPGTVELYADQRRKLHTDPVGREMLISCGAALFGLRLAVRSLGYQPVVRLLPDPRRLRLLAAVSIGREQPMTSEEHQMLDAIPHRHTHRGPFSSDSLPPGVLARVQHHAMAEHATLALIDRHLDYQRLADILDASSRRQDLDPLARHEMRRWSRGPAGQQRDGVPAHAFPAEKIRQPGRLPQRDFDLGRELGQTPAHGHPPAGTGVLLTPGDSRADWLHAGQALHRMLLYAASNWVFASLYTQPLEAAAVRDLIRERLGLHSAPQIILQFGRADTTRATARRAVTDLMEP